MAKGGVLRGVMSERDLNEAVAKVAYDLYKQRGMAHGSDLEDWLEAEKIVMERYVKSKEKEIDVMSDIAKKIATKKRAKRQAHPHA
jgi:hypothetical protein